MHKKIMRLRKNRYISLRCLKDSRIGELVSYIQLMEMSEHLIH